MVCDWFRDVLFFIVLMWVCTCVICVLPSSALHRRPENKSELVHAGGLPPLVELAKVVAVPVGRAAVALALGEVAEACAEVRDMIREVVGFLYVQWAIFHPSFLFC